MPLLNKRHTDPQFSFWFTLYYVSRYLKILLSKNLIQERGMTYLNTVSSMEIFNYYKEVNILVPLLNIEHDL